MQYDNNYEIYKGDENFIFISYDHTFLETVNTIFRALYRQGLRIWFDGNGPGIPVTREWELYIEDRLEKSSMFIGFINNGVQGREQVIKEYQLAVRKAKKDPEYKLVFIFLERVSTRVLPEEVREYIGKYQGIMYTGLTYEFFSLMFKNKDLKQSFMKTVDPAKRAELGLPGWEDGDFPYDHFAKINPYYDKGTYVNAGVTPEKTLYTFKQNPESVYFRVKPSELDSDAVYLASLDNQWALDSFFSEDLFIKGGIKQEDILKAKHKIQLHEIYQALLHHKQIVLNRASLFNTQACHFWFEKGSKDHKAFQSLTKNGSLIVFLFNEEIPAPEDHSIEFETKYLKDWETYCTDNPVYCVKMDWVNNDNNQYRIEQSLRARFHDFLLTSCEKDKLLEDFAQLLSIRSENLDAFKNRWVDIQQCASNSGKEKVDSREKFYKNFLVKPETLVPDCILDFQNKPFCKELKQIVDYRYVLNLANALNIQLIVPEDSVFQGFGLNENQLEGRRITFGELICAILDFNPYFVKGTIPVFLDEQFSLTDIEKIRDMDEWKLYIETISNVSRRSRRNFIDISDLSQVFHCYIQLMESIKTLSPSAGGSLQYKDIPAAVTIVLNIGVSKVYLYYRNDGSRYYKVDIKDSKYSNNHVVNISVDYIFGDLSRNPLDTVFSTFLRLFEGTSIETHSILIDKLKENLDRNGYKILKDQEKDE